MLAVFSFRKKRDMKETRTDLLCRFIFIEFSAPTANNAGLC